ncbi:hypothetical protein [Pontibacter actiniarum]|uniref:STAS/SEC14 domain-containing protein n=1 Tax=Pontibacter actiniarum TaxID=323450 RepID=A0A1X9YR37_9BACT|nr:hypothetical protein [Pontibacter actiniarum]ARS35346.1 hypothetical protein CA264_07780 [Pontibacter actiniarum]
MPFDTKYDSGFYRIAVDESQDLLRAEWLRTVNKDELVEGGTKLYEILRETGITLVMADARVLTALPSDAKDWMASTFYELLSQTGLKMMARVVPSAIFSKIALESVVTRAEALGVTKFEVKNFTDPKDALSWLLA